MDTNSVKAWWNTTAKDDTVIKQIIAGKIVIDGYTLFTPSGHIATVSARKDGKTIQLINCGDVNTYNDFKNCIKDQLNSTTVGGKRKTRRNRKSKKSRKGKSIKNRRKSNRRRR